MEASTETHQHGHGRFSHEKTDAGVRNVAVLAGAFVGLLVFGLIVGYGTFRFLYTPQTVSEIPSALHPSRVIPPAPRLQVNGYDDLRDYLQQQQHQLDSYGWVDQTAGVVRIPIDRAMDLLLQQGLPVRGGTTNPGAEAAAKRAVARERSGNGAAPEITQP
ncbi:MAG TPA: hypothetical protein VGZ29_13360 [Terriglobia bacterium]|nr:hypothetical protein [Terriglobia bacterium]